MNLLFPYLDPVSHLSEHKHLTEKLYLKLQLITVNETQYLFNECKKCVSMSLLLFCSTLFTLLASCNLCHQLICQMLSLAATDVLYWGLSPPWPTEESLIRSKLLPSWLPRSSYCLSRSGYSDQNLCLTSCLVPYNLPT